MLIRRLLAVLSAFALLLTAVPTATLAQAEPEGVPLSLDECLQTALKNNLDLVSASHTPEIQEQNVIMQDSGFDPTLEANIGRTESKSTPIQASNPAQSRTTWLTFGLRQNQAKFGGTYFAGVELGQQEQLGQDVNFADFFRSTVVFDVTFPLLKNFGTEVNTVGLRLARYDRDISYNELERQAQLTMQSVEGAYWDVLAAWAAQNVAHQSLQRAKDLLDLNRKKVEVGTLAPIEITQAEAGVADVEQDVIVAEVNLLDAQDELRRLLAIPQHDPLWAQMINPVDRPTFDRVEIDVDAAIETALASRPEMYSVETGGNFSLKIVSRIGKKAASVFPPAVGASTIQFLPERTASMVSS